MRNFYCPECGRKAYDESSRPIGQELPKQLLYCYNSDCLVRTFIIDHELGSVRVASYFNEEDAYLADLMKTQHIENSQRVSLDEHGDAVPEPIKPEALNRVAPLSADDILSINRLIEKNWNPDAQEATFNSVFVCNNLQAVRKTFHEWDVNKAIGAGRWPISPLLVTFKPKPGDSE